MNLRLCILPALLSSVVFPVFAVSKAEDAPEAVVSEVIIAGTTESNYGIKHSKTATKTDTLLRDTPQAMTVITKELMRDQAMQSMADVIRYVPGIVTAQGEGNRDTAVFRGNSSTADFYVDGIRDDVQYYRDFYNIESVEALKGANSMIFGRGGSGGIINRVSKQADWSGTREIALTLGSWGNRRLSTDLGAELTPELALRVNAMVENSDSYRHGVYLRRSGLNPTLAWRIGSSTNVSVGYEHFKDERVADRGVPSYQGRPLNTETSSFFGVAALSPTWSKVDALSALVEHDFGASVSLRNRTRLASYDKFYQNVYPGAVNAAGTAVALQAYNNATQRDNLFNQTDLMFALNAGGIRHQFVAGIELGRQTTDNFRNTGYFLSVGPTATSINVPLSTPTTTAAVSFKQSASDANNHGISTTSSVYLQDQIEFTPQWLAVVGLRRDRFAVDFTNNRSKENIHVTDTPISPRLGLVFKPVKDVSLYASYSLAFVPRSGDQMTSLNASNKAFDPEKFTNFELGAKWDVLPNLAASAAVYQLDRSNVAIVNPLDITKTILVDGQRSKGVELGLSGKIWRDWSVIGGYAYQDAKITKTQTTAVIAGATLAQVPAHSASLWNRYDFNEVWGAGLGVVYRGKIYTSTDNTVVVPGFTRIDAALYYMVNKMLDLQLNIENVLDEKYYGSANSNNNITPGAPRGLRLGINVKF